MRAVVVTVGNELLSGRTADSNATFVARALAAAGVIVRRHVTVGDAREPMIDEMRAALAESELVVVTGGLGPTADDLTRAVVAELAGVPLVEDAEVAARLEAHYRRLGRVFSGVARRQAELPAGVELLPNPVGLAPGLWYEHKGRILCALPGVPAELEPMVETLLVPRLAARGAGAPRPAVVLRTLGIPESELAERIERRGRRRGGSDPGGSDPLGDDPGGVDLEGVELAYLPNAGGVDLRVVGSGMGEEAAARVRRVEGELVARFGAAIYGRDDETLEEVVGRLLSERGQMLAVAESCTGGLAGARVTRVPGSSRWFAGGVIAYADAVKERLLGVGGELLAAHGAVSAEVAIEMARGVATRLGAGVGLAITGVAGPGGGTAAKPVGLVYVGLSQAPPAGAAGGAETTASRRLLLAGDRHQVRERAATLALECLRRFLTGTLRPEA